MSSRRVLLLLFLFALLSGRATIGWAQTPRLTFTATSPLSIPTGNPVDVVATDLNGDGHPDLAVSGPPRTGDPFESVHFVSGGPGGVLSAAGGFPFFDASGVAAADFNGDGAVDIAVSQNVLVKSYADTICGSVVSVAVFLGPGMTSRRCIATVPLAVAVAAGDFDGDSRPDLAVASAITQGIAIHRQMDFVNNTVVSAKITDSLDAAATALAPPVDLNADGILDLIVSHTTGVRTFLGNGNGTFRRGASAGSTARTSAASVGDVNGDGVADVVSVEPLGGQVQVALGHGDGAYTVHVETVIGTGLTDVAVADLDENGYPDIVVAQEAAGLVHLLFGNGNGTFISDTPLALALKPRRVLVRDWNRDGALDIGIVDAAVGGAVIRLALQHVDEESDVPPGPATLLAPSGPTAEAAPTFTWLAVSDATEYRLWVNDASETARIDTTYTAAAAGCATGGGTCTISPGVALAAGAAMWWIRTANAAGAGPWSAALAFTVPAAPDLTGPSIAIATPSTTGAYIASSGTLAMSGTSSDNVAVTQVTWSTDRGGSGMATGTTAWSIGPVPLDAGVTVVTVVARDAANNTASTTLTVTYNVPPGPATLAAPSGTISTTTPTFTWLAVSGATEYRLWVNDASQTARINTTYTSAAAGCAAGSGTCTVSPGVVVAGGAAVWWIRTANAAGAGSWSAALAFTVPLPPDTTAPAITIATPSATGAYSASSGIVSLSGTATDNVAVTQVSWSTDRGDSGVATGAAAWTIGGVPLGAGVTVITVVARDAANNIASATLTVTYNVAPGAATLAAPNGAIGTTTPAFTWLPVSGATSYQLWVNDAGQAARINGTYTAAAAGCAAGTGTCTVSPGVVLAAGPALWWIRTSNSAGAGSWSSALAFTVPLPPDTTAPSIAIATPSATGGHTASAGTLTMSGTASDNVAVTQVIWSTDRGAGGMATGTTAWTIGAVPLGAGVTVVTVVARDAANNTAIAMLTVTYHVPPGPATLAAPSGAISTTTPTFTWLAVSGATEYRLWVNDAVQAARINTTYTAAAAGCAAGTGTCTLSPGVTLAAGAALWWIRTSNPTGAGSWSDAMAFTVPASSP